MKTEKSILVENDIYHWQIVVDINELDKDKELNTIKLR